MLVPFDVLPHVCAPPGAARLPHASAPDLQDPGPASAMDLGMAQWDSCVLPHVVLAPFNSSAIPSSFSPAAGPGGGGVLTDPPIHSTPPLGIRSTKKRLDGAHDCQMPSLRTARTQHP
jgi:hypothetical protein